MKGKNHIRQFPLPNFKIYYETILIKTYTTGEGIEIIDCGAVWEKLK